MKLKFKKQEFQVQAVNSICDIFEGQQKGLFQYQLGLKGKIDADIGYKNEDISISNSQVLENIKKIQKRNGLKESTKLEGEGINLTTEMETGTGKTYTYINAIYELNKRYGWSKFVIVVPSIAIREGVFKSFEIMQENFATLYGKKVNVFIFDSSKPIQIENFARNSSINVMIINNHAFNKQETNNMYKKTEYGRTLIQLISGTKPILIIDEPQSVEGEKTKIRIKEFDPLFSLRYSATHREAYNMVYVLDAVDAFNMKLVKKISVKGIDIKGTTGTNSYLYLEGLDISQKKFPSARIEIEVKQKNGVKKQSMKFSEGDDLFTKSGSLQQYKGFKISEINGLRNFVRFTNEIKINSGEVLGEINEEHKRRIQIRETIKSHINKERTLFKKGIKAISLFFIDEVKNYRVYDEQGNQQDGRYAQIFSEEYDSFINQEKITFSQSYKKYIECIKTIDTHKGYFSIDKKNQLVNPKESGRGKEKSCDDVNAYDLIMKEKEKLLNLKEPTRFIFSHSALREGWDNPNVFQICVLRNTDPAEVRTRQEVGRGLRLCVDQEGERVDEDYEGVDFSDINILTIVANESYEDFANGLQKEFLKELRERPSRLDVEFLTKKKINGQRINEKLAEDIVFEFIQNGYINKDKMLTQKYHNDLKEGKLELSSNLKQNQEQLVGIIKELYEIGISIDNEDKKVSVTNKLNKNFENKEFKKFWEYINEKTTYKVDFDSQLLIRNSIIKINRDLEVVKVRAEITEAITRDNLKRKDIEDKKLFGNKSINIEKLENTISQSIKYDLIQKIVDETNLTRKTIVDILSKIDSEKFKLYKENPEDFILKVSKIIENEKAEIVIEKIRYFKTGEKISLDIFKNTKFLNCNLIGLDDPNKYIYEYLAYDSDGEAKFARELNSYIDVLVFSKLPKGEYNIFTPVGKFSPDWMIVFDKNKVRYTYFIIETKGTTEKAQLRGVENTKIECAKKHFKVISEEKVKFDVVESFEKLKEKLELV